jgi:hypothetical protein
MGFVDLAMLEIRLGDVPTFGVGVGKLIPMENESTESCPLGQSDQ